jgi:hypothetical protein
MKFGIMLRTSIAKKLNPVDGTPCTSFLDYMLPIDEVAGDLRLNVSEEKWCLIKSLIKDYSTPLTSVKSMHNVMAAHWHLQMND